MGVLVIVQAVHFSGGLSTYLTLLVIYAVGPSARFSVWTGVDCFAQYKIRKHFTSQSPRGGARRPPQDASHVPQNQFLKSKSVATSAQAFCLRWQRPTLLFRPVPMKDWSISARLAASAKAARQHTEMQQVLVARRGPRKKNGEE